MHSYSPSPPPPVVPLAGEYLCPVPSPPIDPGRKHSQIHTLLSLPQVASNVPVEFHVTSFTSFSCPSNCAVHSHPFGDGKYEVGKESSKLWLSIDKSSHMETTPSKDATARMYLRLGDVTGAKETDRTVLLLLF
jgi:hypothetical protein